jgi:hypothetical protein
MNEKLPNPKSLVAIEEEGFSSNDILLDISGIMKLKKIEKLTLTSLVCRESRFLLKEWLSLYGHGLTHLELNLSNGDISVIDSIFQYCGNLKTFLLFVSKDDVASRYGTPREFFEKLDAFTHGQTGSGKNDVNMEGINGVTYNPCKKEGVSCQMPCKNAIRKCQITISPYKTCNSTSF